MKEFGTPEQLVRRLMRFSSSSSSGSSSRSSSSGSSSRSSSSSRNSKASVDPQKHVSRQTYTNAHGRRYS